jgi:hypothetical protein
MVDGFRFGFFGFSDVSPVKALLIASASFLATGAAAFALVVRGYKLRT